MNRITAIFKSLNIEENEIAPVLLLIAQSIFIGTFYGTFDIGAHTLFLKTYPEDMIPKAYIISGLAGIGLTAVYSKLQTRISFSSLAKYTLLFISLISVLMRFFFELTEANWTVFLVFILLGPLNILAVLAFWGTVTRIFNLRQGKRIFGIIDTGQIFGIIISSYAIPLIIGRIGGTKNLLIISAASIVLAMFIEMIISRKYQIDKSTKKDDIVDEKEDEQEEVKLRHFAKNPYILFMALFVVFSMFAAFFVQYSFLVVTNEQYPLEDDLAKYLGFFTGSMMVFTFIIKTFVYSKLMKTYGLKVSLILSPALLALFTGIAIIAGYFGGFEATSAGFIYFFILISLSKLFNKTLKDALEVPSFKLLYQSLSKKIRFDVQAKIDGTINEISALISGVLLSALGLIVFVRFIHYSVVLFGLLLLWTFITLKLYKEYRNSLENALKEDDVSENEKAVHDVSVEIEKTNLKKQTLKLDLIKSYLPYRYTNSLKQLIVNSKSDDLAGILTKSHLMEWHILYKRNDVKKIPSLFENIARDKQFGFSDFVEDVKSNDLKTYLSAAEYLFTLNPKERINLLSGLLRTPHTGVQKFAIRYSAVFNESETSSTLLEFVESRELISDALLSLFEMIEVCDKSLIQMFYKTDISLEVQLSIIDLLGYSNKPEATSFLLENISHHRFELVKQAILALKSNEFQAPDEEQQRFFHPITNICQVIAWDISAMASIENESKVDSLFIILEKEYHRHLNILIDLLSITYNAKSVKNVQEHFNAGTTEGIGYALELFDLFISEEIKPMIILVFEDMPMVEKARLLQNYFPVQLFEPNELILNILNRDPNYISRETKKVALNAFQDYFTEITNDIVAQLFNPVADLQLRSASIINQMQPALIRNYLPRIEAQQKKRIEKHLKSLETKSDKTFISNYWNELNFLTNNNVEFIDLIDYLEVIKWDNHKIVPDESMVNNYFVFLVLNQIETENNSPEAQHLQHVVFSEMNTEWKEHFIQGDPVYIIGIEKEKMNKLIIKDKVLVQNLINHT